MERAAIGIGSNLGDPAWHVRAAIGALQEFGRIAAVSSLYRSAPWGNAHQPDFCNAVVLIDTELEPPDLLGALKDLETRLGRLAGERWGPRVIDLDILLFGERRVELEGLRIPHERLFERAFALVPLAEVDPRYRAAVAGLPPGERESVALMSGQSLVDRVRSLTNAFLQTDLVRLRIEEENEDLVEIRRRASEYTAPARSPAQPEQPVAAPVDVDFVKADLVGIFHLLRTGVKEGDQIEGDRELAYVEALGIRNPVRSLGSGRIAGIRAADGAPVEYGQVLFEIDRAS